jgi:YD repeat-containing protein
MPITGDPAGNIKKMRHDVLGRLAEVVEDPNWFNYDTIYDYDTLDNLRHVYQGSQTRTFVYNSLSRLKSANNPESGTIAYAYNSVGDLYTRTDARGVTSTMFYDGLHRITDKYYNDGTPAVHYDYYQAGSPDWASPQHVGKLKAVTAANVASTEFSYSPLGHVTSSTQTIGNQVFTFNYEWYANGSLKSETYPSGKKVEYGIDDAGRTNRMTADGGTTTYADMTASAGVVDPFTADGRIAHMRLGNGLFESKVYRTPGTNTPTVYQLGTSLDSGNLLQLEYNFEGTGYNNGNVISQAIYRPGAGWHYQGFQYDGVNRLWDAAESGGFHQIYAYDQHGNRSVTTSTGLAYNYDANELMSSNYSSLTNRLTGAGYDYAGNQISYGTYDASNVFALAYDAENRLATVTSSGNGNGAYYYDGAGRRVKKVWMPYGQSPVTTYFVYDALGRLATEISDESGSTGTSYPFTDMLGSVRAITSGSG